MLVLGNLQLALPLFLAPMAGVTDRDFRLIVRRIGGIGVVSMEFISSRAIVSGHPRVGDLMYFSDEERQTDFNRDDAYIDSGRIRLIKPLIAPGIKRLPFKVIGIFNFDFSGFDEQLVIVDYFEAERFLNLGDSVTGIEMIVNDFKNATSIARQIDLQLGGPYRTVDWIELNPELFSSDR